MKINIRKLNGDLLTKVFTNLDIKSIKNTTKSSGYLYKVINQDAVFWGHLSNNDTFSLVKCKDIVRKKYLFQKYIKTGKNETQITFHTNQKDITGLAVYDGWIFCSSDDASVKMFSPTGQIIKAFIGHKGGVWTFTRGGKDSKIYLVTGSTDKTAIIWDMETGIPKHKLKGHTSTVRVVKCFDNYICTGGRDCLIRVWNDTGECIHVLQGHRHSVRCLDIDSKYLLSGSYDGSVVLWDYRKGVKLFNLKSHKARVYCVLLGTKYIVSSGLDAYVHISTIDGVLITRHKNHNFLVIGLSFTDNERYVVSSGADDSLCKWDIEDSKMMYILHENHFLSSHLVYNDLLFVTTQKELKVYDYHTGLFIRQMMEADKFIKVEMFNNNLIVGYLQYGKYQVRIFRYNL